MNTMKRIRQLLTVLVCIAMYSGSPIAQCVVRGAESESASEGATAARRISNAFRSAAAVASPGVVSVYALRGPRMTAPWRARSDVRHRQRMKGISSVTINSSMIHMPDDQGSGCVIDARGLVLTCSHVLTDADAVVVETADGRTFSSTEFWLDPETDVALIRLSGAENLQEVRFGNSDDVQLGDWVISLGSPYDLHQSVSAGIVSAEQRWMPGIPYPMIQSDASTNPGSSGGALINLRGEVIGILHGGVGRTEAFQGIGVATPINSAKRIAKELEEKGHVQRGYAGIQTQPLPAESAASLGVPAGTDGLYVLHVEQSSPADHAGMRQGDFIIRQDGHPINSTMHPSELTADAVPGEKVAYTLLRNGKTVETEVKVGQLPIETASGKKPMAPPPEGIFEYFDDSLGIGLKELDATEKQELELPPATEGVLVTHVAMRSVAYMQGLAAGMAVVQINGHSVSDLKDYKQAMSKRRADEPLLVLLQSNQDAYLVVFKKFEEKK